MSFIVYRAFGDHSTQSYYAYCEGEERSDVLKTFMKGANRTDDRGDRRLFLLNNEENMDVEIMDVFTDELDAFMYRNELRSLNSDSITGPTQWPGNIAARAVKERPETLELHKQRMKQRMKQRGAKTARQAYALGLWTKEVIDKLVAWSTNKEQLKKDFDKLSPDIFAIKYSI